MRLAELWRYPVKSLGGERLDEADVRWDGLQGDRVAVIRDVHGQVLTARTRPRLLGLRAQMGEGGMPLVEGRPWSETGTGAAIAAAAGRGARLVRAGADERFDDTPLLVATDGAVADLGIDVRRLRPNLVIGGVDGLDEREWPGRRLRVGQAVIAVEKLCERCVVTTVDPDTQAIDPDVLRRIRADYGARIALNCHVAEPGLIAVGDGVELVS